SNVLANLDHQLTSLQHDYDKTKTQIDLAHTQYQQAFNQVYKECLSSLSNLQRDEEMRLIDKLEKIQKDFQQIIKLHFGQLIKLELKQQISSINNHYQRGSLLSRINGDSVSLSSDVGSTGIGERSSSERILSNGLLPSGTNRQDYFVTNDLESVVENLRALESIFAYSLSTIHPNVQRNLEEILQMNQ
ncbi:unnamed protein product, partial [Rotaria sordida]